MNSTSRKRVLLISASVILLCMSIIVGMSWSLFTDTQNVKNHLQAGDLSITLSRTKLVKTTLNNSGFLEEKTVQSPDEHDPVDFSDPTDENVFGIEDNEKIVPGTKYVATMKIENNSDVAFGYWIEIRCADKTDGENLAKQLKVTVKTGSSKSDLVGNGLTVKGENDSYVGELIRGASEEFTVTVEFLDSFVESNGLGYKDNDKAQSEKLNFDLIVHAVQLTSAS